MSSFDFDTIIDLIDAKASYAWINCNGDTSKFLDCYNEVTEEQEEEYKNQIVEMYEQTKEEYESYNFDSDDYDINITEFTECELIEGVDHLVKVAINVDIIVSGESSSKSTLSFYLYNGKIIITSISE